MRFFFNLLLVTFALTASCHGSAFAKADKPRRRTKRVTKSDKASKAVKSKSFKSGKAVKSKSSKSGKLAKVIEASNAIESEDSEVVKSSHWFKASSSVAFVPLTNEFFDTDEVKILDLKAYEYQDLDIGFNYNWFGNAMSQISIFSDGFLEIGNDGFINFAISVEREIDHDAGGRATSTSSPDSFKVSFEGVKWDGGVGEINAQVELFPNGDIIFCYGSGDMAGDSMTANLEKSSTSAEYPITDSPFDEDGRGNRGVGFTSVWPTESCWKFLMPVPPN